MTLRTLGHRGVALAYSQCLLVKPTLKPSLIHIRAMSGRGDSGKSYHLQCTGDALKTANVHSDPKDITLFASCFCPFVQRAWIALEYLGIDYKVRLWTTDEVDPYKKPQELLELSPKGLVPALKLHSYNPPRALNESTVIVDFLEDLAANTTKRSLLPPVSDPYARALVRLQSDHVGRTLVPAFYRYLQAQDEEKQVQGAKDFVQAIKTLIELFERAQREGDSAVGLWSGGSLSLADVMAAPWLFRATNVLVHYRGFVPLEGDQFQGYMERLLGHPAVKSTCSTEELYIESYERYAYNRPNTSQVANAINSGSALP
ncbi:glutathione S-transferase [Obba rivulosa]|uniref:Glutathione S-transferase n=1 Tax=Obba rivulosa TaxID=1052685 RepID=A0A8E2DPD4_9APHY|nr:glutathione S-transferase [Obba rivulosa]